MKKISSLKNEEDEKYDDLDDYVEEYFNEFKKITPNEKFWYYTNFQICQGFNVLILFINFWISDYFLDGDFFHYGPNWIYYWFSISASNPMTCIFPDMVIFLYQNVYPNKTIFLKLKFETTWKHIE